MTPDHEHPIDDFVRRAVGVNEERVASTWSASETKQALLQEITAMIPQPTETASSTKARLPRRRLVTFVAVAVLALSAVGVGASTLFTQSTFDDNEYLSGNEVRRAIDEIGAGVPLPSGGSFDSVRRTAVAAGSQSRAGIAGMLGFNAACQWYAHWYHAHTAGQDDVAASTVDILRQVPTWAPIADVDGGGVVQLFRELADDAAREDAGAVRSFLNTNCGPDSGWHG